MINTSPATAATTTPVAAFANVNGSAIPLGKTVFPPPGPAFNTASPSKPVRVTRKGAGEFEVVFPGIGAGFSRFRQQQAMHVQSRTSGTCSMKPFSGEVDGDLTIVVYCFKTNGERSNTPFVVSVASGLAAQAAVRHIQLDKLTDEQQGKTFLIKDTALGDAEVTRTGKGRYSVTVDRLAGIAPEGVVISPVFKIVSDAAQPPAVSCSVLGNTTVAGGTQRTFEIACGVLPTNAPVDTAMDISYTRGANMLGLSESGAYLTAPLLTAAGATATLSASKIYNLNYGRTGGAKITRTSVGDYTVELAHQGVILGSPAVFVVAEQSSSNCAAIAAQAGAGSLESEEVRVNCRDASGNKADTAFQLQYVANQ